MASPLQRWLVALVTATGCTGDIDNSEDTCKSSAPLPAAAMDPLTASEYRHSLDDLLVFALDSPTASTVMDALPLFELPDDPSHARGMFLRMKTDVTQGHVQAWYDIATAVGRELTMPSRIATVMGACATDSDASNDAKCLSDFVKNFGERAYRRPLSADEIALHVSYDEGGTGVDAPGVADVIAGILLAPRFLYHVENGTETAVAGQDNVFVLDDYELASRLSYQFWESGPDAELLSAAASGELATGKGFAKQLDRVFNDPRTKTVLLEFYREWLNLDAVPDITQDSLFKAFAGSQYSQIATPDLRQHMIDEALDLLDYHTWQTPGGLDDVMTTNLSFAKTTDLAAIYGLPRWDGVSPPPQFPPDARPGLLTRAAFLVSGGVQSRPIMRGVLVRRNVLCDDIPDPPAEASAQGMEDAAQLTGDNTTRHITEVITEGSGTVCAGCHAPLINPIGFGFEGFDAIGRARTTEPIFKTTGTFDPATGQPVYAVKTMLPIDSTSIPRVTNDDSRPSSGAADLTRYIVETGKPATCFTRNYFRFTFKRTEDATADKCALDRVSGVVTNNGSLSAGLRAIALSPEFKQRSFR